MRTLRHWRHGLATTLLVTVAHGQPITGEEEEPRFAIYAGAGPSLLASGPDAGTPGLEVGAGLGAAVASHSSRTLSVGPHGRWAHYDTPRGTLFRGDLLLGGPWSFRADPVWIGAATFVLVGGGSLKAREARPDDSSQREFLQLGVLLGPRIEWSMTRGLHLAGQVEYRLSSPDLFGGDAGMSRHAFGAQLSLGFALLSAER